MLVDEGAPVAVVSAGSLMVAFFLWGMLMCMAGMAIAWIVRAGHVADDPDPDATYSPGAAAADPPDYTTLSIPAQRRPRHRATDHTEEFTQPHTAPMPAPARRPSPRPYRQDRR